ncbi:hypothetical protein PR048_000920 [Dryococelus australis]|uniref:Uncharacterized protein n=1 Tax=Dryococelus australis TaxID=614101 RepID=A0ABQ9IH67_9NEOP|nr:hypothetical protein PR048_000920 [Dryococelus australis]
MQQLRLPVSATVTFSSDSTKFLLPSLLRCTSSHANCVYHRTVHVRQVKSQISQGLHVWFSRRVNRNYSPPTKVNRARFPAGSPPNFCMWESYRTMQQLGWFSRGSPVSPPLYFGTYPYSPRFTLIGSQVLDFKNCPNLFPHLLRKKELARSHTLSSPPRDTTWPHLVQQMTSPLDNSRLSRCPSSQPSPLFVTLHVNGLTTRPQTTYKAHKCYYLLAKRGENTAGSNTLKPSITCLPSRRGPSALASGVYAASNTRVAAANDCGQSNWKRFNGGPVAISSRFISTPAALCSAQFLRDER